MIFAYIDPGSSSLFWQMAISALAGVLLMFRVVRQQFRTILDRMKRVFRRQKI